MAAHNIFSNVKSITCNNNVITQNTKNVSMPKKEKKSKWWFHQNERVYFFILNILLKDILPEADLLTLNCKTGPASQYQGPVFLLLNKKKLRQKKIHKTA